MTGIYRNNFDVSLNMKNGFPVFATIIEANHITKKQDEFASSRLTEDDIRAIRELSRDPRIRQRVNYKGISFKDYQVYCPFHIWP